MILTHVIDVIDDCDRLRFETDFVGRSLVYIYIFVFW